MKTIVCSVILLMCGCSMLPSAQSARMVPAEAFSKAYHSGEAEQYSYFRADEEHARGQMGYAEPQRTVHPVAQGSAPGAVTYAAQPMIASAATDLTDRGYTHQGGLAVPSPQVTGYQPQMVPAALQPPPASSAPYQQGQMTSNPSLWPDEGQGASLFRDFRAFQPMDVITIVVKETQEGKKKAETDTETKFSLEAAIKEFFGLETKKWVSNNASLDPSELINATTNNKFEGTGETTRSGSLRGNISAVIMEVLPNGLLRIEGTKIISVNSEEEIMVISGLVRHRDVTASNEVDSSRIANMRIDFFGRGVVADKQSPGWAARIFDAVWPF